MRPLRFEERARLRRTARITWRYFETFVTEADGWLPPDNFQEGDGLLPARLARRTSPTNIGMSLLSMLAAHDLGYLPTDRLVARLAAALRTIESLERFQGHLLNWYDTVTRAPLHPRYVSTVDSGNLAGALLTLAQGLLDLESRPQTVAQRLEGLADTVAVLRKVSSSTAGSESRQAVATINGLARAITAAAGGAASGPRVATLQEYAPRLAAAIAEIDRLEPHGDLAEVAYWGHAVLDALDGLAREPAVVPAVLHALAARMRAFVDEMRFDFLYDRRRRIFAIGYRLADAEGPGRLDRVYYDLLASEARLASFIAIAKGDVPQQHWFHLGRLVTNVDGRAALISWGGTMFEYLMPQLLMRNFAGTLLDQSCRAAVRRQIDYGRQRGVPWGVSESAYAFTDRDGTYQYRAFGVPGLGLRRGLVTDLVIAPYATALASQVSPAMAVENFDRLSEEGLEGRYGFYESVDYNPRGRGDDVAPNTPVRPVVVRAYFSHHQGMSLVALANVVCQDVFVARFHADPRVQATELLLQERVPREAILSEPRPVETATAPPSLPVYASRLFLSPQSAAVHTHFLSNGRYTTAVTNAGGGYSMWGDIAVTRRRADPTTDSGAQFIYVRDPWSGHVWSATHQPVCHSPDLFEATFDLDKITFRRQDAGIETRLDITVSSEDDVEVRRLTLTNRGNLTRELEVTSYAEVALARPQDDFVHPAFGKLFVESEFDPQSAGLLFTRRPRAADESTIVAFHVLGRGRAAAGRIGGVGNGPGAVPRPRPLPGQPARPRRPRLVRHHRRRARSDRVAARAHQAGAWRRGAHRVCHRRGARSGVRAGAGAQVSRWQRRGAGLLDGLHARPHHAAAPGPERRGRHPLRSAGLARVRVRQLAAQPARSGGQSLWPAEPVGTGHLGRPAHRAGAGWSPVRAAARTPAAERAGGTGASRGCAPTSSS